MKIFGRMRDDVDLRIGYFKLFETMAFTTEVVDTEGIIRSYKNGNIDDTKPFKLETYNTNTVRNLEGQKNTKDYIKRNISMDGDPDNPNYSGLAFTAEQVHLIQEVNGLEYGVVRTHQQATVQMDYDNLDRTIERLTTKYLTRGVNLTRMVSSVRKGHQGAMDALSILAKNNADIRDLVYDMIYSGELSVQG